jgi:hypothetical protein
MRDVRIVDGEVVTADGYGKPVRIDPARSWLVWSFEHNAWWAANSCGYTTGLLFAGLYTEAEAKEIEEGSSWGTGSRRTRREEARSLASVLAAEARKGWGSPKVFDLLTPARVASASPSLAAVREAETECHAEERADG